MTQERLKQAEATMQSKIDEFNALEAKKQECLKVVLRLEGEIRVLKELSKE